MPTPAPASSPSPLWFARNTNSFDLEGVPGLPTRIEAKGVDLKARPVDLAETNVGLQPGERRTAVLRLDR